ncbi:hypothetical protein [Amycolatopsis sp. NPDC004378]
MKIPADRTPRPGADEQVLHQLRSAALAAITTVDRDGPADPNLHTRELTAYDLARLFCLGMGDRDNVARSLGDVAITVRLTSGPPARRAARARWVAHELTRLGHADQAAQFTALAADPSPHTP